MIKINKPYKLFLIAAFALCLGVTSCSKDDDDNDPETTSQVDNSDPVPTFEFENGDGFCAAIIGTTSILEPISGISFDIEFGTAVAGFTNDNWTSFVDAGAVSCEMENLENQANESYVHTYTYDPLNPNDLGISFDGNPTWAIAGGNGVPAINHTTNIGFPDVGALTGESIVDRANDYTVSLGFVNGADSIIYQVGSALVTVAGNISSYTFTSDQLSSSSVGQSVAQATAYRIEESSQGGKTIHFINERSKSISVTVE